MRIIQGRNVHEILPSALEILRINGIESDSRNGPVLQYPTPITTVYEKPLERVLDYPWRDTNPFFHFFESMWMLAGHNDVEPLSDIVGRMKDFSDDGISFHGAYGYRWRHHFGLDQLTRITDELHKDPKSRRAVLTMWDPKVDLGRNGKDLPCNDMATFQIDPESDAVNMVVFCRSNDIIWGCYGANAVHFSYLLDYIASSLGRSVGTYTQISVNWHGYLKTLPFEKEDGSYVTDYEAEVFTPSVYDRWKFTPERMFRDHSVHGLFIADLHQFMDNPYNGNHYRCKFFREIAQPIMNTLSIYQNYPQTSVKNEKIYQRAIAAAQDCESVDWRVAMSNWITRRWVKWEKAQSGGPESVSP